MKMYRTSKEKYLFERNRYYCLFSYMKKEKHVRIVRCSGIRRLPFPFRSFASYFKKIKRIIYRFNVHSFCRWNHKDEHYTVIVNIYIFRNRLLFIDVWKIKRFFLSTSRVLCIPEFSFVWKIARYQAWNGEKKNMWYGLICISLCEQTNFEYFHIP